MTSRFDDSRDPTVAAQLAEQHQQEDVYFYTAFHPYSASSPAGGGASTALDATATPGERHFRFSRLPWMPRTERRWRSMGQR